MKKFTRVALESFLQEQATDARVLDVGSGASSYQRFFPNRVTVDVDPERKPDIVADLYDLPFKDDEFPVVLMTEVLEHLEEPAKALNELRRVLSPGGKLIVTTRFLTPPHDTPHDYFRFTSYGLEYLLRDWEDVSVSPDLNSMETLGSLFQRLAFQTNVRGGKFTKAIFLGCAELCALFSWVIIREYGDIKRTAPLTSGLLVSGYRATARKPLK